MKLSFTYRTMGRVLLVSPHSDVLQEALVAENVDTTSDPPSAHLWAGYDWLVSYGYQHILKQSVLRIYAKRIVNLRISLLPWGRDADPNLRAWLRAEPRAVTVHLIDGGIDNGPSAACGVLSGDPTLATTYATLRAEVERLFNEVWPAIRDGHLAGTPQKPGASFHRASDKSEIVGRLPRGWDTPVSEVGDLGQQMRSCQISQSASMNVAGQIFA
jgi:methionyl-tRNA formyltransferase